MYPVWEFMTTYGRFYKSCSTIWYLHHGSTPYQPLLNALLLNMEPKISWIKHQGRQGRHGHQGLPVIHGVPTLCVRPRCSLRASTTWKTPWTLLPAADCERKSWSTECGARLSRVRGSWGGAENVCGLSTISRCMAKWCQITSKQLCLSNFINPLLVVLQTTNCDMTEKKKQSSPFSLVINGNQPMIVLN